MKGKINILYNWLKKNSKILKNIALFIGAVASLLAIISHFSNDKISQTNNVDSSTTTNNANSSSTTIDLSTTNNNTDSSTTNIFIEREKEINNSYSLVGINSQELKERLKKNGIIQINNASNNKIIFSSTGNIFKYGKDTNEMHKSLKGELQIRVNDCILTFSEFIIPSFGPSPKSIIKNDIKKEIENIIKNNTNLILEKIHTCIN
ncbi:hypothetical protein [Flavivirga algicola]|uniref:Uncharacterized protein n=1 Tax=Flavivirga algicola TaxID=2729136 RepID=A0ABX1RXG2_9FLAO|nr:hypothetical protein [Flavivirga algicola]NMH88257.1 hypothetical protein [Flavivirga algicola]